jgi:hypothetical protein
MEAAMFFKGFICGWLGLAAIVIVLVWGMTPRMTVTEFGYQPTHGTGSEYRNC